jgi:hypothetical protein
VISLRCLLRSYGDRLNVDFATGSMIRRLSRPYAHEKRSIQEDRVAAPEAGIPVLLLRWNLSVVASDTQTVRSCIAPSDHFSLSKHRFLPWAKFHSPGIWVWPSGATSRSHSRGATLAPDTDL